MSRFAYFFRETLISLRRNLLMTLAGIMTVAISLFLFGGIVLLNRLVEHGTAQWKNGVELEIFMNTDATQGQISDMRTALDNTPNVKRYTYLDHAAAFKEFKRIVQNDPALIHAMTPADLPTSFRVTPRHAEATQQLADEFNARSGVYSIVTAEKEVKNVLTATRVIRYVFFAMAGVLLASSLFLIVNTIRLATFARRREIEVMRLVGASNWFVRIPFMAEGLVQGLIGAGISFGLVVVLKNVLSGLVGHKNTRGLFSAFYVTNGDAITIGFTILLIGCGIGLVGSMIGLRRFLDG